MTPHSHSEYAFLFRFRPTCGVKVMFVKPRVPGVSWMPASDWKYHALWLPNIMWFQEAVGEYSEPVHVSHRVVAPWGKGEMRRKNSGMASFLPPTPPHSHPAAPCRPRTAASSSA